MQKIHLQLAAALIAACGVASCDRSGSTGANLALNDAPARGSPYPSATPPPAEAPAPAPRADPLPGDALSDTAITSRTQSDIAADPAMAGADVSVNTDKGVVSLTGTVKSREQAAVASGIAQRNDGVMRVDSHLSTPAQ
jgi:hypothetical protein